NSSVQYCLGFEKTLNLAQQSQKLSNSRVFTCDADNLATINQCIHKHPHELLDSVVKERFDGTEGLNRGREFYAANPACQAPAERFFVSAQSLTTATRTGRISQREANHTALNHTVNLASTSRPPPLADPSQPSHSSNSLILKEFSAAPRCEVGRIIGKSAPPSTIIRDSGSPGRMPSCRPGIRGWRPP